MAKNSDLITFEQQKVLETLNIYQISNNSNTESKILEILSSPENQLLDNYKNLSNMTIDNSNLTTKLSADIEALFKKLVAIQEQISLLEKIIIHTLPQEVTRHYSEISPGL